MKNTKLTWNSDVRVALAAVGLEQFDGIIYNDLRKIGRRMKFYVDNLTDESLAEMQRVIQARRPEMNVTVSRWYSKTDWDGYGNVVVYYKPKTSL